MKIVIIKYNAGNIYSVVHALKRLNIEPIVSNDPEIILKADKIIFPGQGEAHSTMNYLRSHKLDILIKELKQPVLGICIGMQLMCQHSEEGNTDCLGIFNAEVKRFIPIHHEEKVPHMGWNTIYDTKSPLYEGVKNSEFVYFVHSYYVPICNYTIAKTDYIQSFSSSLQKDNFYATQFHPEKSGKIGEKLLTNFININL